MAWNMQATEILRVLLNDMGATPTYSDATLFRILLVSAFQVNNEVDLTTDYKIDVQAQTIAPDPSSDESFMNLLCLKAACIVDRGSATLAAKQAIAVKDGASAIDLKGVSAARQKLLEKGGWCPAYEMAKLEYQVGGYGVTAGAAVMSPFRLFAEGSYSRVNSFSPDRSRDWYPTWL
jgi:hypothetical protein